MNKLKDQLFRTKVYDTCKNCSNEVCYLKKRIIFKQNSTKNPNHFYLDYIYNPKVYLTDIIDDLKKKKKITIIKRDKNVEM